MGVDENNGTDDVSRATTLDLGNLSPDELLGLWERVERVKRARSVDPELREAILSRVEQLGDRILALDIRAELDEFAPAAVLSEYWRELVPNRPVLGSFTEVPA